MAGGEEILDDTARDVARNIYVRTMKVEPQERDAAHKNAYNMLITLDVYTVSDNPALDTVHNFVSAVAREYESLMKKVDKP
jgi:hypothetical protein